ncbi:MAG TPA: TetR/AcrR family transcriptional regulator [Polyangiaceae bacterium]|jgi:AcrR family transcriptional regulator|nr:TetR/AcrR family transcriptional regulator [Polyangiaceae bacterium]
MPPSRPSRKPAKKPRQVRSRETYETILEGATRVFAKHGYARSTTNRIAEAAGVSVGSVYQYFPDKDAMLTELMRRYRENLVERIGERLTVMDHVSFETVVHTLLTALLNDDEINPALRRVLIERVLRTDARREVGGFEERVEGLVADALRAAKDYVAIEQFELSAFILVRVVLAISHAAVVDRPVFNTPALASELTRLVVGYVGRRPLEDDAPRRARPRTR